MKKYLFILMGVLSIFFFDNSVNALSFNYKGVETEVSRENYIYYIYQEYTSYFEDYNYFIVTEDYTDYNRIVFYFFNNFKSATNSMVNFCTVDNKGVRLIFNTSFVLLSTQTECYFQLVGGDKDIYTYSNLTFKWGTNTFNSNISKDELKNDIPVTIYTINYYVNNELYKSVEVEEGTNYTLIEYLPPKNYSFSGWSYDENIDLTNITSDINIYGTTSYVRPDMNYSENIDSVIHELSVSIIGKNVPVEFDYVYTIMDFIILLVLVLCVIMPFVILIKLLGGGL